MKTIITSILTTLLTLLVVFAPWTIFLLIYLAFCSFMALVNKNSEYPSRGEMSLNFALPFLAIFSDWQDVKNYLSKLGFPKFSFQSPIKLEKSNENNI